MKLDRVIGVRNDKTIYRDGNKCVKVFGTEYAMDDVLNEALNQARVEKLGLNIPKIMEVSRIEDKWAIVSEYIKGKTLAQLMKENIEKKDGYLQLFVDLQLDIQSKACLKLNKQKDKLNSKICMADLDATTRFDLHSKLEEMPKHNKVCHGDFNPENIVIAEDKTPYILDWSHVTQGNAAADAAITYLSFLVNGDEETAKEYLELFCQKSDTEIEYVKKWLPIVAAAKSVKSNEKERELLLTLVAESRESVRR